MCNVNSYQQCGPGGCGDCAGGLESSPSPSCSAEKHKILGQTCNFKHFLIVPVYAATIHLSRKKKNKNQDMPEVILPQL